MYNGGTYLLASCFFAMIWNILTLGLVVGLVFGAFDGFLEGGGMAQPYDLALIILLLRLNQILTYIAKNLDEIKELLLEDEDDLSEIMYHPPYEVEE